MTGVVGMCILFSKLILMITDFHICQYQFGNDYSEPRLMVGTHLWVINTCHILWDEGFHLWHSGCLLPAICIWSLPVLPVSNFFSETIVEDTRLNLCGIFALDVFRFGLEIMLGAAALGALPLVLKPLQL